MDLTHEVRFSFPVAMPPAAARAFVRDVPRSLRKADFLTDLQVLEGDPRVVVATLPVNAALFGQRELPFRSVLRDTPDGATLTAVEIDPDGPGWAEVDGEAVVRPDGDGSKVDYAFRVTIRLRVPAADKWGTQALLKMIAFTARTVLQDIMSRFPLAVRRAAEEVAPVPRGA